MTLYYGKHDSGMLTSRSAPQNVQKSPAARGTVTQVSVLTSGKCVDPGKGVDPGKCVFCTSQKCRFDPGKCVTQVSVWALYDLCLRYSFRAISLHTGKLNCSL